MTPRTTTIWLVLSLWLCGLGTALAQDQAAAIEELKKEMKELRQEISAKDKKIDQLENRLDAIQQTVTATPAKKPVKAATVKAEPSTPEATRGKVVKAVQGPKETLRAEAALDEAVKALQEKAEKAVQDQKEEKGRAAGTVKPQEALDQAMPTPASEKGKVTAASPAEAPSTVAASADNSVLQEQIDELKEQIGQVVDSQKQEFLSKFNPSIGFVGETLFNYNSQPAKRTYPFPGADIHPGGFDVFQRSMDLNIAGSVDPFARGYAVLNASADPVSGEAAVGVEEAAIYTTSLPWNLTVKGGRFFGEFGRLSYIHDHELPFVFRPLVLDAYIGGESRTDGIQINWLLPFKHYVSLTTGVGSSFGGTPNALGDFRTNTGDFRKWTGFNFWGRLSTYFDITPNISFEPGISWLFNPNASDRGGLFQLPDLSTIGERERRVGGVDVMLRYQPLRNNQFKSLTWGTEVLFSDNRYDTTQLDGTILPSHNVGSYGLYSYVAYRFHRQWTAGFEFQYVQNAQDKHQQTYAYSPYLTWYPSHWNMLRLEYTYTQPYGKIFFPGFNEVAPGVFKTHDSNMVTLQWAWIIGSHAHGWQER